MKAALPQAADNGASSSRGRTVGCGAAGLLLRQMERLAVGERLLRGDLDCRRTHVPLPVKNASIPEMAFFKDSTAHVIFRSWSLTHRTKPFPARGQA